MTTDEPNADCLSYSRISIESLMQRASLSMYTKCDSLVSPLLISAPSKQQRTQIKLYCRCCYCSKPVL